MTSISPVKIASVILCIALMAGCVKPYQPIAPRPGSISSMDAYLYDSLTLAQTAIDEADKVQTKYPAIVPTLVKAKSAFNIALRTYKSYHCTGAPTAAGCAGVVIVPVDISTLNGQISTVLAMAADLMRQIGSKL